MAILNRITTMLRGNVNDVLDRAEDPKKVLDQTLRDMSGSIRGAHEQVAEAFAQLKLSEASLKQSVDLSDQWQRKAELAVQRGADDLARESLRRKRDYDDHAQKYEDLVAAQSAVVGKVRDDLRRLESKLERTKRAREMLLVRHHTAKAQQSVSETMGKLSLGDPTNALARMDERIRYGEARAAAASELAGDTLESRLSALGKGADDLEIEADLMRLKSAGKPRRTAAVDADGAADPQIKAELARLSSGRRPSPLGSGGQSAALAPGR